MKPTGRYDSPFVRRVGISLRLLGLCFVQLPLSASPQATEVRKVSPRGRLPMLGDGERQPAFRARPLPGRRPRQRLAVAPFAGIGDRASSPRHRRAGYRPSCRPSSQQTISRPRAACSKP